MSTRYLQLARASLARTIRYAEAHDLVGRNVATLVDNPKGQIGRPSRSFTLEQSLALLEAAKESRLNAYVVLSLATGLRTEEARELHSEHVDLDGDPGAARPVPPSVAVWHSVRQGGDTKTAKSRRTLALPQAAAQALREHWKRRAEDRLAAGALWQDHDLVFASAIGTPLDAAKNRYVGAISVGFGPDGKRIRRKVTGRTKAEVRDKLKAAHAELDRGLHTSATYTVRQAVEDWLEGGLPGRSERTRSIYREALKPLLEHIGLKPLRELTARDVRRGLEALSDTMSTRYLQLARASLARAIRYAEAHDLVGRNVATLVDNPKGQIGRPSRSFTLEQSLALLEAARESRLNAYVVLSLATGIRTEEARELHWEHVDLDGNPGAARPVPPSVAVWHSVRQGGDTKTAKSRRTLALPQAAVLALREHRKRQAEDRLAAGALWQDHGLVFASAVGTPLDAANVRREFRKITEAAGLGVGWAPRDLRHTFVSLMSADGVPIEEIARLAGHNRTATTELVYRHELRPVITTGAEVMDRILNLRG